MLRWDLLASVYLRVLKPKGFQEKRKKTAVFDLLAKMGFLGYQAVRLWPAARSNKMKKMQNIKKKIVHYPHKALKVFMWILQQCPWNVDIISKDCYVLISDIASCIWKLPYFPELFKTNLFWTLLLLWLFHFFNVFDIMWFSVPSFHFKLHCFALFVPFFLHNHITEISNSLFLAFTPL